jgi:hypothetical protein
MELARAASACPVRLSSDFMLSTCRLAQIRFEWVGNAGAVIHQMVDSYRHSMRNRDASV